MTVINLLRRIPLWLGIVLAPFTFLAGTVIAGEVFGR